MFKIPENETKEQKIHYVMMVQKDFLAAISEISDFHDMNELKNTIKEWRQWKKLNKKVLEEIFY